MGVDFRIEILFGIYCFFDGKIMRLQSILCLVAACIYMSNGATVGLKRVQERSESLDCTYKGEHHVRGSSFPSGDGCNDCFCVYGSVTCTTRPLGPNGGCKVKPFRIGGRRRRASSDCTYNGKQYAIDEDWISSDGCNICICTKDGAGCTED